MTTWPMTVAAAMLVVAPLLAGGLSLAVRQPSLLHVINLTSMGLLVLAELLITRLVLDDGPLTVLGMSMYFDALSVFVLFIIGTVGLACSLYMRSYLDEQVARGVIAPNRLNLFFFLFHMFLLAMVLATTANSIGVQWVAVEATTLATTFLIAFWRRRESLEAGWKYLILCSVGISLALFGVVLVYYSSLHVLNDVGKALNVTELFPVAGQLNQQVLKLAFIFILVGYGTKVGLVPMHSWLPDAYTEAPAPVVAMLAGVLEVVAVYAILRIKMIVDYAAPASFSGNLLLLLGFASFVTASLFVLVQRNYKRLFAYSSIEHMGIAMIGFGIGGTAGTFGGLFHLLNHAFAKSVAFFAAGNVHRRFRTVDINQVQGVIVAQPWTAMALLFAGLALSALPPGALFASETSIVTALTPSRFGENDAAAFSASFSGENGRMGLVTVFFLSSVLAFGGLIYRVTTMVWGTPQQDIIRGEAWTAGHVPMALLIAALVAFGFALPAPLRELLGQATDLLLLRQSNGEW